MRCRKVRSLLSTYCNEELAGRQQVLVKEHLAGCASCRKEAATYQSIEQTAKEMPGMSVSADFNTKLLNRIAEERFAETRNQAYLPKRAPWVRWRIAVPAVVTCALAVIMAIGTLTSEDPSGYYAAVDNGTDASYETVQPIDNPNMNAPLDKDWQLDRQLAQMERFNRIASQLRTRSGFGSNAHLTGTTSRSAGLGYSNQRWNNRVRVQPVIRVYQSSGSTTTTGEVKKVY